MSQAGASSMQIRATTSSYEAIVPEVFIHPSSPIKLEPSEFIDIPFKRPDRHLEIGGMHQSSSAPTTSSGLGVAPLTRERRSQSVPLSLDAVRFSKQIVNVSDKFHEKQTVKMRLKKTYSGDENRTVLPKRHSDIVEELRASYIRESSSSSTTVGSAV